MSDLPPEHPINLPPADVPPTDMVITARPIAAPPQPPLYRPLFGLPPLDMLSRRQAAWDLLLVLFAGLIIPFAQQVVSALASSGLGDMQATLPPSALHWLLIRSTYLSAFLVVGLALYLVHRHRLPARCIGVQLDRWHIQSLLSLPALGAVYVATIATMLVIFLLVAFVPELKEDLEQRVQFMEFIPTNSLVATVLLIIPVAIQEELLYRGLLLPYLRRVGCNWIFAILISSLIFASMHIAQGGLAIVQVVFLGIALALSFLFTRSLLAVIIAHFLYDVIQIQLARYIAQQV